MLSTQQVEKVDDATAEEAARRHGQLHFGGVGVDAPQPTDLFYRLIIERCFYVGGMGSACKAEDLSAEEYKVGQLQLAETCCPQPLNGNSATLDAPTRTQTLVCHGMCIPLPMVASVLTMLHSGRRMRTVRPPKALALSVLSAQP